MNKKLATIEAADSGIAGASAPLTPPDPDFHQDKLPDLVYGGSLTINYES